MITGGVFSVAGIVAIFRLAGRRPGAWRAFRTATPYLFFAFAATWYVRWLVEPSLVPAEFSRRAPLFMAVFAIMPFIAGITIREQRDCQRLIGHVSRLGLAKLLLVAFYWLGGRAGVTGHAHQRWSPIPPLAGNLISLDLGFGCLAAQSLQRRGGWWRTAAQVLWIAAVIAVQVRVGARGPFLFFVICLAVHFVRLQGQSSRRTVAVIILALAASIAAGTMTSAEYESSRPLDSGNYSFESNLNRIERVRAAFDLVALRPLLGWGGSLVGRPIASGLWDYVHFSLLDPLLEGGLVAALPYWLLLWLTASRLVRGWKRRNPGLVLIGPSALYMFLENQVAGHITSAKQLWLLIGVINGLWFATRPGASCAPGVTHRTASRKFPGNVRWARPLTVARWAVDRRPTVSVPPSVLRSPDSHGAPDTT